MLGRLSSLIVAGVILMRCAAAAKLDAIPPDHPASPQADESPVAARSSALQVEPQDTARTARPTMEDEADAPGERGEAHAAHAHGAVTAPVPTPAPAPAYICPMHPDVVAREPGRCPTCGMDLLERKATQ